MENDYENYEIIVIAGGQDHSFEEALKYQNLASDKIKVYEQKTPNKNKALNLGLTHSSGILLFLLILIAFLIEIGSQMLIRFSKKKK